MGGDHKCPLCSATFTRPQHVGRHLRAHTGDRPYECKECPLRFARSDLLSRHVNKAHKPPDENGKPQQGKKGRRKSMPSSAHPRTNAPPTSAANATETEKARRASFDHPRGMNLAPSTSASSMGPTSAYPLMPMTATATGPMMQSTMTPPQPAPPPLQAQQMYPHHPLLAGTPPAPLQQPLFPTSTAWTSSPPTGMNGVPLPNFSAQYPSYPQQSQPMASMGANGMVTFQPPFTAVPMRLSGSDQGSSPMGRVSSMGSLSSMGYEFGFKKRACDQCNHSKVRCDFAEPCHRCTHRGVRCTYMKPQKSRSIATITNPRLSLPMSATNSGTLPAGSATSTSPQSHFSSPATDTSPLNNTMPPPANYSAQQGLQPSMSDPNQLNYLQSNPSWQNVQWQGVAAQPMDQSLGLIQQSPQNTMYPSANVGSVPSTNSSQFNTLPLPLPHRNSGSSSVGSPNHLAPTPSLTSNSTSPSDYDHPNERRSSSITSFPGNWQDPNGVGKNADVNPNEAYSISPSTGNAVVNIADGTTYQHDMGAFAWAPPATATIDPRLQFRNPVLPEEEDQPNTSRPGTASTSAYMENAANAERRRSSIATGVWANFNQMSLQDAAAIPADPYTASQYAYAASTRRPTFPMLNPQVDSSASNKMPSLGDVKDLWKLFMSEPMSSSMMPSSSGDYLDPAIPLAAPQAAISTPRPLMGARGLSKSNSMPDLTSPLANNQPFFAAYHNGPTPKPTLPQPSYTYQQVPEAAPEGEEEGITMKRWKDSIKNRQASFELNANAGPKLKSASPPGGQVVSPPMAGHHLPLDSSMSAMTGIPTFNHNRPLASVLQHSSALQQTLAPERVPSFGGDNLPTPTKNSFFASRSNAAKFSSALARPGNKRLASQTLVPNDGKKAERDQIGGMMGWEGASVEEFSVPAGLVASTGMTPNLSNQQQFFAWHVPHTAGI